MLFETLLQGKIFACTIYFGIIGGIFLTAKIFLDLLLKKNKYVLIITDIAVCIVLAFLFLVCINTFNYGEFRFYELLGFLLGIILEQISLNKLVEKFLNMIYTMLTKVWKRLRTTKIFQALAK